MAVFILALCFFKEDVSGEDEAYFPNDQYVVAYRSILDEPRAHLASLTDDYEILEKVAWCESGWKAEAKNPNSTASGIFQFIESTWLVWGKGEVFDPHDNIEAAVRLYEARGLKPWEASRICWAGAFD